MAATFAFAESRDGNLRKVAFETVTTARRVADASGGGEVHALLMGAPGIAARAAELGRYGADLVVVVEDPGLAHSTPEACAATAAERLRAGSYRAGFFSASAQGRDLAPRTAARQGRFGEAAEMEVHFVHRSDTGERASVFTHVLRRRGRTYLQYWLYLRTP